MGLFNNIKYLKFNTFYKHYITVCYSNRNNKKLFIVVTSYTELNWNNERHMPYENIFKSFYWKGFFFSIIFTFLKKLLFLLYFCFIYTVFWFLATLIKESAIYVHDSPQSWTPLPSLPPQIVPPERGFKREIW